MQKGEPKLLIWNPLRYLVPAAELRHTGGPRTQMWEEWGWEEQCLQLPLLQIYWVAWAQQRFDNANNQLL